MITTGLVALLVLANLVVSNTTSSDDADASAAETATTSNAPPVDASIASSEPANVEEGQKIYSRFEDTSFSNAGELEDLIAAALDPDVDIDSWLPESLPEFMCDYVGLLREIRSTPPGTPYYLELQKELEEDKARWKREDYIFSRLRKLLLEGDHGHQNSSQGTLKDKEGSGTGHVLPLIRTYVEHCGILSMYGDAKYGVLYNNMVDLGVTLERFTAALASILEDPNCPKARRLTESQRWTT